MQNECRMLGLPSTAQTTNQELCSRQVEAEKRPWLRGEQRGVGGGGGPLRGSCFSRELAAFLKKCVHGVEESWSSLQSRRSTDAAPTGLIVQKILNYPPAGTGSRQVLQEGSRLLKEVLDGLDVSADLHFDFDLAASRRWVKPRF